ncbi:MAG TPA: twin-arginine translocase subunit TatC [Chitinophagaceae bacterium]|nr:twin-arginine translocase subunit TatC [Chitinophagaceae bacterium]
MTLNKKKVAATEEGRKSFFKKIRGQDTDDAEMSFIDHLEALRWHVVRSLLAIMIAAVVFFIFIDWIFDNVIMGPTRNDFISYKVLCSLSHKLRMGDSLCMPPMELNLQVTSVSGTFMSSISIAFVGGIIVALPYVLLEIWKFVKPALKPEELKHTRGVIFWVSMFFFLGASFGYFIMAPFTFNFLANYKIGTAGILLYRPMLSDYLDSLIDITLGAGLAFELPMASWILSKMGLITPKFLSSYRKYAYVALLVIAAIITPSPDWGSQLIVVIPLIMLYELSILISARVNKAEQKKWEEWQ